MRGAVSSRWDAFLVGLVASVSFLLVLGNSHFWEQDEGFYAATALEMLERNDWIVPTFNHELFAHKPPLMFWGIRLGYWFCGVGETGARLFSAVAGVGTCILVYYLASRLFDRFVGLIAGIALASNIMFCVVARSATADAYLTFFVAAALAFWFLPYDRLQQRSADLAPLSLLRQIPTWCWIGSYICMGLGVLTKGPIGFLFPITILAASFWSESAWFPHPNSSPSTETSHGQKSFWQRVLVALTPAFVIRLLLSLRLPQGLLVLLLVAAPWFWMVDLRSNGAFLREFIGVHHLGRFSNAMDNHSGPIYYYLLACLAGFYPWSGFAIPIVICWMRQLWKPKERNAESSAMLWLSVWFCVYIVVFSIAKTKLPNYILPAYPVMAIAAAYYWREVVRRPGSWLNWQRIGYACNLLIGASICLAPFGLSQLQNRIPAAQQELLQHLEAMGLLSSIALSGIPIIVVSLLGLIWTGRESNGNAALPFAYCAASLLFVTHLSHTVTPKVDYLQSPQILVQRARQLMPSHTTNSKHDSLPNAMPLSVVSMFRPTLVYYAGGKVQFVGRERFVEAAWESERNQELRFWLVQQEDWEKASSELPQTFQVLDAALNFPKPGDLLLVGNADLLNSKGVELPAID